MEKGFCGPPQNIICLKNEMYELFPAPALSALESQFARRIVQLAIIERFNPSSLKSRNATVFKENMRVSD
jgi:hypothetical protein